ncbi:malonate decarboxylase holo-[acyl-carrier-protein] synthase [Dyella flava]|uniref:Malonate decarboxylase holo-[acyl-carrier-protein] synthase n=1 Tax=Dyella flava TaxID=1920170 RepID=A0ABS2JYP6_9GAMM|nr:malonate decarboxylase holo-[acyl-carrier-protein] synthase [Dyella flava]MBM7124106.1 malonate decarboxylase holo-[acyl-carrier-protein] synthase [Dyella flava]
MNLPAPRSDQPLQRHQLVRVLPAAWDALLASRDDLANEPLLHDWARRGWPLIVRRPSPGDGEGLPLGLPLPPSAGKRRISIQMRAEDIIASERLPTLADCFHTAPPAWHPSLRQLMALAKKDGVQARVFGSLAWQRLTGLVYLSPRSDLDIIWTLPGLDVIHMFLADLAEIESHAPMRLDGELVRADGAGVNWRELHAAAAELVLKTANDVILCTRESFIGTSS